MRTAPPYLLWENRIVWPGRVASSHEELMRLAIRLGSAGQARGAGNPFGAVIADRTGRVIAAGANLIHATVDATAHAEVVAIRRAQAARRSADLRGLRLFTSCAPCIMCAGAAHWAAIGEVVAGARSADAAQAGFVEGPADYDAGKLLRELGVRVREDVLRSEALELLRRFRA